jgi:hypothetical protein
LQQRSFADLGDRTPRICEVFSVAPTRRRTQRFIAATVGGRLVDRGRRVVH